MLKERTTYEIIDPVDVGAGGSSIVLTARSGRHALRHRLEELGYVMPDDEFERVHEAFLELADKKKEVYDEDLEALVGESERTINEVYHLEQVHVTCGEPGIPTATVELVTADGEQLIDSSHGNGPVDAVYNAINRIVGVAQRPHRVLGTERDARHRRTRRGHDPHHERGRPDLHRSRRPPGHHRRFREGVRERAQPIAERKRCDDRGRSRTVLESSSQSQMALASALQVIWRPDASRASR